MFQIYRALGILNPASPSSDEPYEFTLKLGKLKKDVIIDDNDESDTFDDDKARDPNKPKETGDGLGLCGIGCADGEVSTFLIR
jgi:hypothetical protein